MGVYVNILKFGVIMQDIPTFEEIATVAHRQSKKKVKSDNVLKISENIKLFHVHVTGYDYPKLISSWKRLKKVKSTQALRFTQEHTEKKAAQVQKKSPEIYIIEKMREARDKKMKHKKETVPVKKPIVAKKHVITKKPKKADEKPPEKKPDVIAAKKHIIPKVPKIGESLFKTIKKARKQIIEKQKTFTGVVETPKPLTKKQQSMLTDLKNLKPNEILTKIDNFTDHTLIEFTRQYRPELYNDFTMGRINAENFRTSVKTEIAKMAGISENFAAQYFTGSPFADI